SLDGLRRLFARATDGRRIKTSQDHLIPRKPDGTFDGVVTIRKWGIEVRNGHRGGLTWSELCDGVSLEMIRNLFEVAVDGRDGVTPHAHQDARGDQ
ncbi:MAG: hypothetical protein V1723_01825, partial [Candidatus Uhrbacteria bacterium]